jgi:hypothetical protein
MTSEDVIPKCSQRADGPILFGDRGRKRDDVMLGRLFDFLDARDVESATFTDVTGSLGRAMPAAAMASAAAVSTSNQVSYRRWSLQIRPMSGCV